MSSAHYVGRLSRHHLFSHVSREMTRKVPFVRIHADKEESLLETNESEKCLGDIKHDFSNDHRVCRVVASPDGKLPTVKSALPSEILSSPLLLEKLDAIYHAISHEEARQLSYLERSQNTELSFDQEDEMNLVSVLRNSLDDAGFELLTKRDIDLCEALNAGYLLRLSIEPDVSGFDPSIAQQFYPERFDRNGNPREEFPLEGRVLLYRRGYSSEVTEGRLILPKLDYLQANLVQRSARAFTEVLGAAERQVVSTLTAIYRRVRVAIQSSLARVADSLPSENVAGFLRNNLGWKKVNPEIMANDQEDLVKPGSVQLIRYGGKKRFVGFDSLNSDPLDPFLECVVTDDGDDTLNAEYFGKVNGELDSKTVSCQDDAKDKDSGSYVSPKVPARLLERVSINNVVDLSTTQGRRSVVKRFFAISQLVEPAYEEVVAIWRPLPEKPMPKPKLLLPKFVCEIEEIFEMEDKLPELDEP